MPLKVPTYDRQVARGTPNVSSPRSLRPPSEAFGAGIGESIARLGEAGQKVASALMKRAQERQEELMEKEVIDQDTSYRQEMQGILYNEEVGDNNKPKGYLSRNLEQTKGITPEFDQAYSTIKSKYLQNVNDARQKDALSKLLDSHYMSQRESVIRHEREQTDKSIQNSFESNLALQVNEAAKLQDGESVIRAIQNAITTQNTLSKINGYDEKTSETMRVDVTGKIANSAFATAMAENNLIQAQSIYQAVKGRMPADAEQKMKDQIESDIPYNIAITDAFVDPIATRTRIEKNAYNIKDPKKRKAAYDLTNTVAERMISESREERNNNLLDKIDTGTAKLIDIENEMQIPEELGGLPRKQLSTYYQAIQTGTPYGIKTRLSDLLTKGKPTELSEKDKGRVVDYLRMIDFLIDDNTDAWHAREKLAEAWADGRVDNQENKFLDNLKTNMRNIEINKNTHPIKNALMMLKNKMEHYKATNEEIALNIKQLLGTLKDDKTNPEEIAKTMLQNFIYKKIPQAATFSEKGQLTMNTDGDLVTVYPIGFPEPYFEKTESAGIKDKQPQEKK